MDFEDLRPTPEEQAKDDATPARALVVVAFGRGLCIDWTCPSYMQDQLGDDGAITQFDHIDFEHLDHEKVEDGLYICDLRFQDAGEGDWPGSREVEIQAFNLRPATKEEWTTFCEGETPWEIP